MMCRDQDKQYKLCTGSCTSSCKRTGKLILTEYQALHITRIPYGFSEEEITQARLYVCDKMEQYKDAYENIRDYALACGLDTTAYIVDE